MSTGDDLRAGKSTGGEGTTEVVGQSEGNSDFGGDIVLQVKPFPIGGGGGHNPPFHDVVGVRGVGWISGEGLKGEGGDAGGHGVLGLGGHTDQSPFIGAGVVGVAGGHDRPQPRDSSINESGVFGRGKPGVYGQSKGGRGGVFESTVDEVSECARAQLRLVPHEVIAGTPFRLPKRGAAGDLLVLSIRRGRATLFFCVNGVVETQDGSMVTPAIWARVQLEAPLIPGDCD